MKRNFLLLLAGFLATVVYSQGKPKSLVHFCNTKNEIVADSLAKCAELFANEQGLKIISYTVKFELAPGQMKVYNVLGSVFTPELIKTLTDNRKSINIIDIDNILSEKEGQFIKLPPARFLFFF